jgi:hypothetical protein
MWRSGWNGTVAVQPEGPLRAVDRGWGAEGSTGPLDSYSPPSMLHLYILRRPQGAKREYTRPPLCRLPLTPLPPSILTAYPPIGTTHYRARTSGVVLRRSTLEIRHRREEQGAKKNIPSLPCLSPPSMAKDVSPWGSNPRPSDRTEMH